MKKVFKKKKRKKKKKKYPNIEVIRRPFGQFSPKLPLLTVYSGVSVKIGKINTLVMQREGAEKDEKWKTSIRINSRRTRDMPKKETGYRGARNQSEG